jgi:lysyl-tRNA synthetase class II
VEETFYKDVWKKLVDLGDFVGVEGELWITKTGKPTSARAASVVFLGKTLRPSRRSGTGSPTAKAAGVSAISTSR